MNDPAAILSKLRQSPSLLGSLVVPKRSDLLDMSEAAAFLKVSRRTVERLQSAGLMPLRFRKGHKLLYAVQDVKVIAANRRLAKATNAP